MGTDPSSATTVGLPAALIVLLLLAGCAGFEGGGDQARDREPPKDTTEAQAPADSSNERSGPQRIRASSPPPTADSPCNGRPGVEIPAVDIPAVTSEPVVVDDQQIAGETVEGFTVPGVEIAAQRVPAQCAVEEPAPAGCLGRVVIPPVEIPAATIPAVTVPGVSAGGGSQAAVTEPAVAEPAVREEQVVQEQVCAQKVEPGEVRPSVVRPPAFRPAVTRRALTRPAVTRPAVCGEGGCVDSVIVDSVIVDSVIVDSVVVDSKVLEAKQLPEIKSRCTRVLGDRDSTAYNLCADVLFAFNKAEIRPRAETALREVARSIERRSSSGPVRVEGHTDAKGDPAYNERLSLRRAQAVRRWLIENGDIDADRIAVRGLGETRPVAPNEKPGGADDPKGRRENRRVVIGVTGG